MRISGLLLLFFSLLAACHTSDADKGRSSRSRDYTRDPFDRNARIVYTKHARCRMDCRHITAKEIHEILDEGQINYAKSDPHGKPDPKYALDGYTEEKQHLRIVIAPENEKLIVITCIEIDVEWACHCN